LIFPLNAKIEDKEKKIITPNAIIMACIWLIISVVVEPVIVITVRKISAPAIMVAFI
jgi:hypothetical protein